MLRICKIRKKNNQQKYLRDDNDVGVSINFETIITFKNIERK